MPNQRGITIGADDEAQGALLNTGQAAAPSIPTRDSERMPAREYYRSMARPEPMPEGALKYHIDKRDFVPDCDHEWVAIRVNGMETGALGRAHSKGWVPARACDFPVLSRYGKDYGAALRAAGYTKDVQADAPIEIDGEMLMVRSAELSAQADRENRKAAQEQVDTQMRRLEMISKRHLGERTGRGGTEVRYGHVRQYANPELDQAFGADGEV